MTGLNLTTNEDGYGYIEIQLEDFNGNVSEKTRVYYGEPPKTNKTLLEKTYEYALNQSTEGVVDSAVKNFEEAKAAAKAVLDNAYASQDEINTAWSNLVDAIHGLGLLQGDKTNLKMLIDMAEAMDESKYVDTNWKQPKMSTMMAMPWKRTYSPQLTLCWMPFWHSVSRLTSQFWKT